MKLAVIQSVIAVFLIVLILLQERSAGLSGIFGGDTGGFYQTRRGIEKLIFRGTIVLAAVFVVLAILHLLV